MVSTELAKPCEQPDTPLSRYEWGYPWIVKASIEHIEKHLDYTSRVLEWGSGGSTIWFAKRGLTVTTIEHQWDWHEALTDFCNAKAIFNVIQLYRAAVPPEFKEYAEAPLHLGVDDYDVIMIDGADGYDRGYVGSRPACARIAARLLAPGGIIILDNSGGASNIPAVRWLEDTGFKRYAFVGPVLEPPEHPRLLRGSDVTETSIFVVEE